MEETIETYCELYDFLRKYKNNNILEWLSDSWKGKDKQKSLLRLFAELKLIEKLKQFNICEGKCFISLS